MKYEFIKKMYCMKLKSVQYGTYRNLSLSSTQFRLKSYQNPQVIRIGRWFVSLRNGGAGRGRMQSIVWRDAEKTDIAYSSSTVTVQTTRGFRFQYLLHFSLSRCVLLLTVSLSLQYLLPWHREFQVRWFHNGISKCHQPILQYKHVI